MGEHMLMKYSGKKLMSIFLALALAAALSLLPAAGLAAATPGAETGAIANVSYLYYEGGTFKQGTNTCTLLEPNSAENVDPDWTGNDNGSWIAVTPQAVTGEDIILSDNGKLVETVNVTINERIKIGEGVVNLVLCDGATLTVTGGIEIAEHATLNIYAGSLGNTKIDGTGRLYAGYKMVIDGSDSIRPGISIVDNNAGIDTTFGTLTIHGGVIKAVGGEYGAGIGGGNGADGGTVTIYGGTVTATGYEGGAGIGGGNGADGGTVTISGGNVTATGHGGGAGIGGGSGGVINNKVSISGGTVNAMGGSYGAGIGGGNTTTHGIAPNASLTISGGTVTATGGESGAGIGGGGSSAGISGTLTISGGTVTATGGKEGGAGIGGGKYGDGITGSGSKLEISGGSVIAIGGNEGGAGIGGGSGGSGIAHFSAKMEIKGGTVVAIGGSNGGAGIGGGYNSAGGVSGATLTISGGNVTAMGGGSNNGGAGIGGGFHGTGLDVDISGGIVTATGGYGGAGIGSGNNPSYNTNHNFQAF